MTKAKTILLLLATLPILASLTFNIQSDSLSLPTLETLTGESHPDDQAIALSYQLSYILIIVTGLLAAAAYVKPDLIPSEWILTLATILICLALFEGILRINPAIAGYNVANEIHPNLGNGPRDIFIYENGTPHMKPNFQTKAYFNGYWWNHSTDDYGFRNPETYKDPDILLLGDSHIYGHGLEQHQTIAQHLRDNTNYTVLNMARIGDTIDDYVRFISQYNASFNPDHIFHFYYHNDIRDLNWSKTENQQETFINTPITNLDLPDQPTNITKIMQTKRQENNLPPLWSTLAATYIYNDVGAPEIPDFPKSCQYRSREWSYMEHGLRYIEQVATQNNASFTLAPIIDPGNDRQQQVQNKRVQAIAQRINASYMNISHITRNASNRLPHDRHLNQHGHKKISRQIQTYLDEK